MKKLVLILALLTFALAPGLAHAGGFHAGLVSSVSALSSSPSRTARPPVRRLRPM